ncbi:MAG: DUF4256 domain-containing protein [Rubrivivax sp.]
MAISHATSGQVVDIVTGGNHLASQKTFALFKSDELEVMRLVLPAGKSIAPHCVVGEITLQCLEGRVEMTLEARTQALESGKLMYLAGGVVHSLSALTGFLPRIAWPGAEKNFAENCRSETSGSPGTVRTDRRRRSRTTCETMKTQAHDGLLRALKARFEKNMHRHEGIVWSEVQIKLEEGADALRSILAMEVTGGEPDVMGQDKTTGHLTFCDFSAESPAGRRSVCYDREALDARKEHKPEGSAVEKAAAMGVELLTETQYRALQIVGEFDTKSSSWIRTPPDVRSLGGALFCDRRYGKVFVHHNGAQSYYAARGFRGSLRV